MSEGSRFSADRTIRAYASDIWHVKPDPAPAS